LRGELPELVSNGTISAETARALDRHYAAKRGDARNVGFGIVATLGSAFVAAGIILLIAHNWDELSRALRSIIAFLPLVAAQLQRSARLPDAHNSRCDRLCRGDNCLDHAARLGARQLRADGLLAPHPARGAVSRFGLSARA
jgi:hypothetical protein